MYKGAVYIDLGRYIISPRLRQKGERTRDGSSNG